MYLTPKQKLVMNQLRRPGAGNQRDVALEIDMSESAFSKVRKRAEARLRKLAQQCGSAELAREVLGLK